MRIKQCFVTAAKSACCFIALAGCCQHKGPADEVTGPKVQGDKVTFPPHSPQAERVAVSAAELPQPRDTQMTGRLVWNDDVTVRVFSPVSGHIHSIITAPGQPVGPGEVLAKVASPE